jgi:hypothetical protein
MSLREAEHCVITVGEGRGFVARGPHRENLIVTAVECHPIIPSDLSEIPDLLGRLGAVPFLSANLPIRRSNIWCCYLRAV